MSTEQWIHPITKKEYFIGTIGIPGAWPRKLSQLDDIKIPTYGFWAGPGYAGGARPTTNAAINWNKLPCRNASIDQDMGDVHKILRYG